MPSIEAASRSGALRQQKARAPKVLYAVDACADAGSPAGDPAALTAAATRAVAAGGGHVLEASRVTFPNGAITLVLILAESHLSVHTWPEDELIAIDLFSCGAIDGKAVIAELTRALALSDVSVREISRGIDG
jgi:S-adenosylmethionine decarboxylase